VVNNRNVLTLIAPPEPQVQGRKPPQPGNKNATADRFTSHLNLL